MTQNGIVTQIQGGNAHVSFTRSEACAQCRLCDFGQKQEVQSVLPNRCNARVGDTVCVELHANKLLRASAVAYLIPLAALLLGLVLGQKAAPALGLAEKAELFACLTALVFVAVSFLGIRLTEKRRGDKALYAPQMLYVVDPADEEPV